MAVENPKIFRLNHLTGGVNSISERDNLISFSYNGIPVQSEAADIENFAPLNRGGQSKTSGFSLFQNIGTTSITGLYRFIQSTGNSLFIASCGSTVYKIINGVSTAIANVSFGATVNFETAMDYLVICDGVSNGQLYNGTLTVPFSSASGAPSVVSQALFYQNRLWLITPTSPNGSYVYYSDADDINSPTSNYAAQFVQCNANDGQTITSISKYFVAGTAEPILFVTKTRSVGVIQGDGSTGNPYTFSYLNLDYGVPGSKQVAQFGQILAYLTPGGVATFTGNQLITLVFDYISEKVRNKFEAFNLATLNNAIVWYDWVNTRLGIAAPEAGQLYNNVVWYYDIRLGCWYKERYGNTTAVLIDKDGTRYHGDNLGNVYVHNSSVYTFNNYAINAYYTTPYLDFGDPNIRKRITSARITYSSQGSYNLTISNSLDYGARSAVSNIIYMNAGGGLWSYGSLNAINWGGGATPGTAYAQNGLQQGTYSIAGTLGITLNGTLNYGVVFTGSETNAQIVSKINTALGGYGYAYTDAMSHLNFVSEIFGTNSSVLLTPASNTQGRGLGIRDGFADVLVTYTTGTGTAPITTWGQSTWVQASSINSVVNNSIWGTFDWEAPSPNVTRFFPSGYFYNMQFTLTQNGLNQPVDIFEIEFTVEFEGV